MEPKFTSDWFSHHIPMWEMWLSGLKDLPFLDFLEIGSYEGRSTIWLLENIIKHNTCKITCIDSFIDHEYEEKNQKKLIQQFIENTKPYQEKIRLIHQESFSALQNLISMNQKFDFIYIDGCHEAINVLEDAVLSFKMLKQNGIMILYDYNWVNNKEFHEIPRMGINSFITTYSHYIKIVYVGDQLVITKL
jgi:predicted O-methyltransferase YrrM